MAVDLRKPIIVVVGATASGKTDLAIKIAQQFNGEIICADSRTVYKGMDIGTAKPTKEQQSKVKHHLIDILNPDQTFNASKFKDLANAAIKDIESRGKLPIIVGGTGLYVDALIFDYQFGKPADLSVRSKLESLTTDELVDYCVRHNVVLPTNTRNRRHLVRAAELGGLKKDAKVIRPNTLVVGISTDNETLKDRIKRRAEEMVDHGVVKEAVMLGRRYGWNHESMTGNVYRLAHQVVEGNVSNEQAIDQLVKSDLSLAKRQATWFKRNEHIIWGSAKDLIFKIGDFLRTT